MIILQTHGIAKSFGIDPILSDINMQIQSHDRVGLVGVNGAGKSTLLKIITGRLLADSGVVQASKGLKLGYLAQDTGLSSELTMWEEMKLVFSELIEKEKHIRRLEITMSNSSIINNEAEYEKLMNEYSKGINEFREQGGYSYEAKIRGILSGLGFSNYNYFEQNIETLSGGQKTRLALAKLLLEEPNLLVLDEPTNYLDVTTLTWLEGYLKTYSGAILVVSHDRYFLDALVTVIYEIERTKATKYNGNYSQYVEQKVISLEMQMKSYEKQQGEISKLEDFIQKNIARASTTRRAQSRRKTLEKVERMDKPTSNPKSAFFSFETEIKSGNNVLNVKDLSMEFYEQALFKNVSFNIKREERVALVGPNGIGKSTLFKIIMKELTQATGTVELGANVSIGYYSQEQDNLSLENQVIDELWDEYPDLTESEIRTTLGNFLFIENDVYKKVKDLSGGEKARLSLAKLILKKANFLLLDEPTNHLDIFSREVLENSLVDYPGTLLFISHDRYFLNRISTHTLEIEPAGVRDYLGNYDYFIEKKAELAELNQLNTPVYEEKLTKNKYMEDKEKQRVERQLKRRVDSLEIEIAELEVKLEEYEQELIKPSVFSNHELSYSINNELVKIKDKLDDLLVKWSDAQKELEGG